MTDYSYGYHRSTIRIEEEHREYLDQKENFNLSGFVRDKLDEMMAEDDDFSL